MGDPLTIQPRRAADGDTPETPLNPRQSRLAWDAQRHPCVRMCLNEITKRLFAGDGLVAMRGEEKLRPSPAFASYLHRELMPFARDAFSALQSFGVVPIAFRAGRVDVETGAGEHRVAPFVPAYGTYTITTGSRHGQQYFVFYWGSPTAASASASRVRLVGPDGRPMSGYAAHDNAFGRRDESVIVAADFGWNPDLDGTLTSNLATVVENVMFHQELVSAAIVAERIGSNPPVFTAYNPAADAAAVQRDDNLSKAWFAGSAARQASLAKGDPGGAGPNGQAEYERTRDEARAFRLMLREFQDRTGLDAGDHFGVGPSWGPDADDEVAACTQTGARNPHTGHAMPWANQFYLGASRAMVHQQMPQVRADLVQLTQTLQETVCGVLSVPRTLIVADAGVKAGVEAVEATMNRTVQQWADVLANTLTRVYRHLFGEADLAEELRMRVEQKRRLLRHRIGADDGTTAAMPGARDLLGPDDLFEAASKTNVTLTFDLVPITSAEALDHMHDRGVITWRVYAESLLRLNSMPRSLLAAPTEPSLAGLPDTSPFSPAQNPEPADKPPKAKKSKSSIATDKNPKK